MLIEVLIDTDEPVSSVLKQVQEALSLWKKTHCGECGAEEDGYARNEDGTPVCQACCELDLACCKATN